MLLNILEENHITYVKDVITEKERSTRVKDHDYGEVFDDGIDIPRFAYFEYSDGEIIYENYDNLDSFLENEFIPKYVSKKRRIYNKTQEKQSYLGIPLNKILSLKLSQKEEAYTLEYLEKKGIYVNGYSESLGGEFSNYNYIKASKMSTMLPKQLSKEETIKKLEEYAKTKNQELRNEIVEGNMRLARYMSYKYSLGTNISQDELEGYAYEGLIYAVEKFKRSLSNFFSTYATACIRGFILRGITEINGFRVGNVYSNYRNNVKALSQVYDEIDQYDFLVEVGKSMAIGHSTMSREYMSYVMINDPIYLDEYYDKYQELEELDDDNLSIKTRLALDNGYIPEI